MRIPTRRFLLAAWAVFVIRGAFYAVLLPPWEGFDEWAHFAYIQHLVETGVPPHRAEPISASLCEVLHRGPLAPYAGAALPGTPTYRDYWTGPTSLLPACPMPAPRQYEAQQPPLYYLLMTPVYRLFRHHSIPTRLLAARLASVLLASTALLSLHGVAVRLRLGRQLSALAFLAVSASPGLLIDIARAGNESLAVALVSALLLAALHCLRRPHHRGPWAALGLFAAAALLTKAYALAFLPVIVFIAFCVPRRARANALLAAVPVLAAAALWYPAVWRETHTLSGEQFDIALSRLALPERLAAITRIDWLQVLDIAAFTHIWTGGWSFLVARSWIYRAIELLAVIAALGLLRAAARRSRRVLILLAFLLPMAAVLAYHALAAYAATGDSTAIGWYFYAVVAAESAATALGLQALFGPRRAPYAFALLPLLFVILDLYTIPAVLVPAYTAARLPDSVALARLVHPWSLPPMLMPALAAVHLAATAALLLLTARCLAPATRNFLELHSKIHKR